MNTKELVKKDIKATLELAKEIVESVSATEVIVDGGRQSGELIDRQDAIDAIDKVIKKL